ncbi:PIN domain-containing protein [Endothiovibrio diazotrophicus]
MILLDTDVVSEWMKPAPSPEVIAWIDRQEPGKLYLPAVGCAEIETGIARLPEGRRKAGLHRAAGALFEEFRDRCLPLDCEAAEAYGEILAQSKSIGLPVTVEDAQIAAIATSRQMTLATP